MDEKRFIKTFANQNEYEEQKNTLMQTPCVVKVGDDIIYHVPSVDVTIGQYKKATFFCDYPVSIPKEVKAFISTSVENDKINLTQIYDSIPAYTGVYLELDDETEPGVFTFYYSADKANMSNIEGNLFHGTTEPTYIEGPAYMLGQKNGIVKFYLVTLKYDANGNPGTTHFKNNAYKVYMK